MSGANRYWGDVRVCGTPFSNGTYGISVSGGFRLLRRVVIAWFVHTRGNREVLVRHDDWVLFSSQDGRR